MKKFLITVAILLVIFLGIKIKNAILWSSYESSDIDLDNIRAPLQINIRDKADIIDVSGIQVTMKKVVKYDIAGRIVAKYTYDESSVINKMSPVDLALIWGVVAKDNAESGKVSFAMTGRRSCEYRIRDENWFNEIGRYVTFKKCFSNNHIIPANPEIDEIVRSTQIGDTIHMRGYLIKAYWNEGNRRCWWESSTSRDDSRNHACEIMYVESAEILKK